MINKVLDMKRRFNKIVGSSKQNLYGVSFLLMVISLIVVPVIKTEAVIAPADYVVYTDGATIYAQNGQTGVNDYSGTDAATVIQSAINTLTNGGKIFIKKGTYLIATHSLPYSGMYYGIYLRDNILIAGEGRDTILKAASMPNIVIVNEQFVLNGLSKNYNIEICDIAIQGYAPTGGTPVGSDEAIRMHYVENVTVERVYVSDFNGGAVNFSGSESYQAVFPNKPVNYNIVVKDNEVINCYSGIRTRNGAKTIRYFNNYLYKVYYVAFEADANQLYIQDVKIEGNVVDNPMYSSIAQGSIRIVGESDEASGDRWCSKVSIENNYIGNTWVMHAGIFVENANRVLISGNILNRIGPEGITLWVSSVDSYNFLVTDNHISEPGLNSGAGAATQSGILIGAGLNRTIGNILVSGNKIDGSTAKKGIYERYIAGDASWGGTITNTQYVGNQVYLVTTGITGRDEFDMFQGNPIYKSGNRGRFYKEDNRGTASVTGAVTTVTVAHGLSGVPTIVIVAPQQQGSDNWSVTSRDATNFVITFATAPNANTWYFDWYAEYKP